LKDDSPDSGCGIKVFWRDVFVRLPFFTSMHRYLPMLYRCYGFETACHPVNDRPRLSGKSKYTNFERLMLAIYDLIGVVWLRRRTLLPRIEMDSTGAARAWPLDEGARGEREVDATVSKPLAASPNGHGLRHDATIDG